MVKCAKRFANQSGVVPRTAEEQLKRTYWKDPETRAALESVGVTAESFADLTVAEVCDHLLKAFDATHVARRVFAARNGDG